MLVKHFKHFEEKVGGTMSINQPPPPHTHTHKHPPTLPFHSVAMKYSKKFKETNQTVYYFLACKFTFIMYFVYFILY